jgi:hypothetical protein
LYLLAFYVSFLFPFFFLFPKYLETKRKKREKETKKAKKNRIWADAV